MVSRMSRLVRPRLVARLLQQCRREAGGSATTRPSALQWPLDENTRLSTRMLEVEKHWRETTTGEGMSSPPVKNNKSAYVLSMFPYPSGALHMGHLRVYTISDVIARYYRADGHEVIHPIGWDAFGLPAENAARERGVDPAEWTKSNIESMKGQLLKTGIHFDWDREINTSSPDFYRWTQWIFTQMHRAGLVRRGMNEVNWDPVDNTVLAAEQIDADGRSWRSGAVAEKRRMNTWLIETPKYAKRLLDGLSSLEGRWHEVADIQSNWIGRCDVRRFMMPVRTRDSPSSPTSSSLEFLDLRLSDPLSLLSAAFVLLSATDSLVRGDGRDKDQPYISSLEVLNVVTGRFIPIVVVPKEYLDGTSAAYGGLAPEYVLGARLSHEGADTQLAASLGLEMKNEKRGGTVSNMTLNDVEEIAAFGGYGGYLTSRNLMDWAVSRQRAWGTPIPMILGEDGSSSAIPAEMLPLLSEQRGRKVEGLTSSSYETDTLDTFFDSAWYYLRYLDPRNQKQLVDPSLASRHMPVDVYVGGVEHAALHLYYARFFSYFLADIGAVKYEGTLEPFKHLVPQGIVKGLTYVDETNGRYVKESDVDLSGTIPRVRADCTTEGVTAGKELKVVYEKMSKSKHNGVDPVKVLEQDGIDLARLQLLDTSSPRAPINWGETDSSGIKRWLDRMSWVVNAYVEGRKGAERGYAAKTAVVERKEEELREAYNYFVRNVGMTLEVLHLLNTSIARLQGLTNALRKMDKEVLAHSVQAERCIYALITMLQVFAPHTAAELYAAVQQVQPIEMKTAERVSEQPWPEVDADAIIDLTLHVNGVNCGRAPVQRPLVEDLTLEELITRASSHEHKSMIDWLRAKEGVIKTATTEGRKGFFITLSLEALDANGEKVSEEKIKKQLDEMAKVRIRLAREEKKKEKKKKAQ